MNLSSMRERSAPTPPLTTGPVTPLTPLAVFHRNNSWAEGGPSEAGCYDSNHSFRGTVLPLHDGRIFEPAQGSFEQVIAAASDRARAGRIGDGAFPAQAVIADAATGAYLITSFPAALGSIDGYGYAAGTVSKLHDAVLAIVGGAKWVDLRSTVSGDVTALPTS